MMPDQQIATDVKISVLLSVLIIVLWLTLSNGGYAPVDTCANQVLDSLSPYQVQQLTDSSMPPRYTEVARWCTNYLDDWASLMNDARSYREFSTPDMY